jgi:hypothetical protein
MPAKQSHNVFGMSCCYKSDQSGMSESSGSGFRGRSWHQLCGELVTSLSLSTHTMNCIQSNMVNACVYLCVMHSASLTTDPLFCMLR